MRPSAPNCTTSAITVIVPDVNLLIHAMNTDSDHHAAAWSWWSAALNGDEHIGLTWPVLIGYLRLTTHPRILGRPLDSPTAATHVRGWIDSPRTVLIDPGPDHVHVMERLLRSAGSGGDLIPDAHLAALAIENGGTVYSQDADFARFDGVRWVNPLT